MKKLNLQRLAQRSKNYLRKSSPTILSCIGAVGVVATSALAVRATPKAIRKIRADSKMNHNGDPEAYSKLEAVRSAWVCYIPAAISGTAQKIIDAIASEKAKDVYITSTGLLRNSSLDFDEHDPNDERLFYDAFSNRYFESSINRVIQAEYHLNRDFVISGYLPVNHFYELLGLTPLESGNAVGWSIDDGLCWIDFNHSKVTLDDGLEVLVIDMDWVPDVGWDAE